MGRRAPAKGLKIHFEGPRPSLRRNPRLGSTRSKVKTKVLTSFRPKRSPKSTRFDLFVDKKPPFSCQNTGKRQVFRGVTANLGPRPGKPGKPGFSRPSSGPRAGSGAPLLINVFFGWRKMWPQLNSNAPDFDFPRFPGGGQGAQVPPGAQNPFPENPDFPGFWGAKIVRGVHFPGRGRGNLAVRAYGGSPESRVWLRSARGKTGPVVLPPCSGPKPE